MPNRNFEIFSCNELIAVWENAHLTVLNESLLPLYLLTFENIDVWLESRAADHTRPNIRLLKKALRLAEKDDVSTVIHVNGATITDNYWIRPIGSDLTYDDVKFTDDYFSGLALKGNYDSFNRAANSKRAKTPELTNIGSFEKCWKLRDGKWWMYKKASHNEMFSELFVYELGCALGMNMAVYARGDRCIKSLDFTDNASVNFEPASTFMGDNKDYSDVVAALEKLCPEAIPSYVRLIFMDALCANPDRHTNNFGLLHDTATGKLLGLAPNYDNNIALISRGYPTKASSADLLIVLFNELLDEHSGYREYLPVLSSLSENIVSYSVGRFYTECVNSTIYPEFSEMERMDEKGLNSKEMIGFSKILRNAPKRRLVNLQVNTRVLCKFYAGISAEAFSLLTAVHQVILSLS